MQLKTQKSRALYCFKDFLQQGAFRKETMLEFIKFLGQCGVDEVRLMEPMPFGKSGRISRMNCLLMMNERN